MDHEGVVWDGVALWFDPDGDGVRVYKARRSDSSSFVYVGYRIDDVTSVHLSFTGHGPIADLVMSDGFVRNNRPVYRVTLMVGKDED